MNPGILVAPLLAGEGPHSFAAHLAQHGFLCLVCGTETGEPPRPDFDSGWVHPSCAHDPAPVYHQSCTQGPQHPT